MILKKGFTIKLNYIIYASPSKVFDALTKEGIIGQWCDGGGKLEPKVGGAVAMFGDWVKGEVLKFDSRKKELSYSWKPAEWSKKTEPSVVEYSLKPHVAGTEVTLIHSNFPSKEESDKHLSGWTDYVFEPLNDFFTS